MTNKWTEQELKWLTDNYEIVGELVCAKTLNRSTTSIRHKASRLGLRRRGTGRRDRIACYDGYEYVSSHNNRYATHRHVMSSLIGRPLTSDEVVHHKDGNTLNNHPDNLELHTRSSHMKLHNSSKSRDDLGRFVG